MSKQKSKMKKDAFFRFLRNRGESGVKSIATEYAEEENFVTYRVLAERHCFPERLIKQIVEYAITQAIVTYQVACKIKEKAHYNQAAHYHRDKETTSDEHYDKLLKKRFEHLKKTLLKEEIFEIAYCYTQNPAKSTKFVARKLGFSEKEVRFFLRRAIAFNYVDDQMAEEIISIALEKNNQNPKAKEKFDKLLEERSFRKMLEERKKTIISELNSIKDDEDLESYAAEDLRQKLNDVEYHLASYFKNY